MLSLQYDGARLSRTYKSAVVVLRGHSGIDGGAEYARHEQATCQDHLGGFDSELFHFYVTTLAKLFTHLGGSVV